MLIITVVTLLITSSLLATEQQNKEIYFKFNIEARKNLERISNVVSIDNVKGTTVFAYATPTQFENFKNLGYSYTKLKHPGLLIKPQMASNLKRARDWDYYPTYDQYLTMMYQFESDYPDICEIINIGTTVDGRDLLFARITDNIDLEENEPEFMYTATMHGDETAGYVLMLRLINYLLTNYGSDAEVTAMVDDIDIWINPLANPDGTYADGNDSVYGATRYNANGVDLNRNFPDPEDGPHPDGNAWQPETIAMMDIADAHSFVHSANFHGGAEVVNYPWDTWDILHADDDWYFDISRAYADTVHSFAPSDYMTFMNNGITRGYVWYSIAGGRQDYMNWFQACREVTIEISDTKLLPASELDAHWDYNKRSFINYMKNVFYGIRGVVTDNMGNPLAATISIPGHDFDNSEVFTDPDAGDYHRMLLPGTYDLEFSAYGYETETINNVTVVDTGATIVNVTLNEADVIDVSGFVKNGNNYEPIPGAVVEIVDTPIEPDTTNNAGYYSLETVLAGTYTFKISAEGYPTLLQEEVVSQFHNQIDFMLLPPDQFNDFELDDGGYTSNDPAAWQWGEPTAGGIEAYSGNKVWGTVLDGYYGDDADWTLETPSITIPENAFMSFYHYYDSESTYDGGNVAVSLDGGSSFDLLIPEEGYVGNVDALGEDGFTGTNNAWTQATINLDAFAGQDAIIRWKFASDYSVHEYYGWYIDDVAFNHYYGVNNNDAPEQLTLFKSYPNPFSKKTNIKFALPNDIKNPQLNIYNVKGQIVKKISLGQNKGNEIIFGWNGADDNNKELANGIYFYQLKSDNYRTITKKMIKIK